MEEILVKNVIRMGKHQFIKKIIKERKFQIEKAILDLEVQCDSFVWHCVVDFLIFTNTSKKIVMKN